MIEMRLSIRTKIFGISFVLLLFLTAIGGFGLYRIGTVLEEFKHVSDSNIGMLNVFDEITVRTYSEEILFLQLVNDLEQKDIDADGVEQQTEILNAMRARILDAMERALLILKDAEEAFVDDDVKVPPHELQAEIREIEKEHDDFFDRIIQILNHYQAGEVDEARTLELEERKERADFLLHLEGMVKVVEDLIETSSFNADIQQREVRVWTWVLIGVASMVGVIAALTVSSRLVKPLFRVVQGAREVEQGNLDVDIVVTSRDEVGTLADSFNQMTQGLRTKERIKETFGKYLDPRIVKDLIEDSSALAQAGKEELVTVFFSDIKDFTPMGEKLTPAKLVRLLNEYLTVMSDSIKNNHGVIDKYIGDAIMAFWGAPFSDRNMQADSACQAALNNLDCLLAFRDSLPSLVEMEEGFSDFSIRIGLATGKVIVGSIGSSDTKSYTIIGDTVNLAARLESLNKQYGTSVLLSQNTRDMLDHKYLCREIDRIVVMGKQDAVSIHELLGFASEATPSARELCSAFAHGLEAYRSRNWAAARTAFESCLEKVPDDGPSRVFLDRLSVFQEAPPPEDWDGIWVASKK